MSLLAILRAVLSLANVIANIVREQTLMSAGEAKEVARQLTGIGERLGITEHIRAEVAALPDADIDKELSGTDAL